MKRPYSLNAGEILDVDLDAITATSGVMPVHRYNGSGFSFNVFIGGECSTAIYPTEAEAKKARDDLRTAIFNPPY